MKAIDRDRELINELLDWLEDRGYTTETQASCVANEETGSFRVPLLNVSENEDRCGYVIVGWVVTISEERAPGGNCYLQILSVGMGTTILAAIEEAIMNLGLEKLSALEL